MIVDDSVIARSVNREDLHVRYIPVIRPSTDLGIAQVANFAMPRSYLGVT